VSPSHLPTESITPHSASAASRRPLVAGIDGAPGGWVVVTVGCDDDDPADVRLVPDLLGVVAQIDAGTLAAVAIDIPIGLAADGARRADVEARQRLGPRRSSVFPAPVRSVLAATTYEEACSLSRTTCGKAISKQLFNILPKIREVDALVTPQRQQRLFEMSPELSLAVLAGTPMAHPKTMPAGRAERIAALGRVFNAEEIERHLTTAPRGAGRDDILDAFAGAWTARRHAAAQHLQLGGDLDAHGLRMEVIA
jgi:predicted RNase H-like nuclease